MKEIIAMHGWGGDSYRWKPWIEVFRKDGWQWHSAERGYGDLPSYMPTWKKKLYKNNSQTNVLICHSLGSHLIDQNVLENATHVVLLSSFSRFIPEGKESRSIKTALEGMKQAFGTSKEISMLLKFREKANKPHKPNSIPNSPIKSGISISGRKKLINDLELLINTKKLPPGFPVKSQVLVVNGKYDDILSSSTKNLLIKDLVEHLETPPIQWNLVNDGHALLDIQLRTKVKEWIRERE